MTDPERLDPSYRDERGWKHEPIPQPKWIYKPMPPWKRIPLDAWLIAAVLVAAAGVCVYLAVRG